MIPLVIRDGHVDLPLGFFVEVAVSLKQLRIIWLVFEQRDILKWGQINPILEPYQAVRPIKYTKDKSYQ
jgi:hypothetical protein